MQAVSTSRRRALQVGGSLLFASGLVLFGLAVVTMVGSDLASGPSALSRAAVFGFSGVLLFGVGGTMAKFGFLRPISEYTASETAGAVEHAAGAVGRGLTASGVGTSGAVVRVRCRSCGFLESEDARFCSSCGGAV